jgi:hypothetical protein
MVGMRTNCLVPRRILIWLYPVPKFPQQFIYLDKVAIILIVSLDQAVDFGRS